jgi:hypothetical protein
MSKKEKKSFIFEIKNIIGFYYIFESGKEVL